MNLKTEEIQEIQKEESDGRDSGRFKKKNQTMKQIQKIQKEESDERNSGRIRRRKRFRKF